MWYGDVRLRWFCLLRSTLIVMLILRRVPAPRMSIPRLGIGLIVRKVKLDSSDLANRRPADIDKAVRGRGNVHG